MKVDGQCHCGAIVYEAEVEPGTVGVCHCSDCQQLTGSPFRANIRAEAAGFCILKGQPRHYVKTGDSGAKRTKASVRSAPRPFILVPRRTRRAILPGRIASRVDVRSPAGRQIWTKRRLPWIAPLAHVPEFEGEA